jgi:UDP-N-acetylglucosamine 2-epimerase (non-hydrolysing)/GDP/UDP-N,N'-diacetylbacillosamine 2-epimerase (hydrolysing)
MSKNRTIAVFTGNRAEYGLQMPILRAIAAHPALDYKLIVSGAHLDPHFGRTLAEIEADGFDVAAEVAIDMPGDTLYATANAIGSGILSLAQVLDRIRPDLLVVYADRFEGFAAVITGTQMGIPTAHIEGGDLTEGGALDDSVRHAMTKLAHLHFTTNQQAANRILGMGEEPWRVHVTGFPMIDLIKAGELTKPDQIYAQYNLSPERPIILFTQHSVTIESEEAVNQVKPSLEAMRRLAAEGAQVILTYPNNDAGGRRIIAALEELVGANVAGIQLHRSLGRKNFHGILALAQQPGPRIACVGNSSAGIKETPAFGCPTVNIGSRQLSRLRGDNVTDADYDAEAIYRAVYRCLFDEDFRSRCAATVNPYGEGDSGRRIAKVLAEVPLDQALLRKGMTLKGEAREGWFR